MSHERSYIMARTSRVATSGEAAPPLAAGRHVARPRCPIPPSSSSFSTRCYPGPTHPRRLPLLHHYTPRSEYNVLSDDTGEVKDVTGGMARDTRPLIKHLPPLGPPPEAGGPPPPRGDSADYLLIVTADDVGVVVTGAGEPATVAGRAGELLGVPALQFGHHPSSIAYCYPYIVSANEAASGTSSIAPLIGTRHQQLEVHATRSRRDEIVQCVELPSGTAVVALADGRVSSTAPIGALDYAGAARGRNAIYVGLTVGSGGGSRIARLVPVPVDAQIEQMLRASAVTAAQELLLHTAPPAVLRSRMDRLNVDAGRVLFFSLSFDAAFAHLIASPIDPREVILMMPELQPCSGAVEEAVRDATAGSTQSHDGDGATAAVTPLLERLVRATRFNSRYFNPSLTTAIAEGRRVPGDAASETADSIVLGGGVAAAAREEADIAGAIDALMSRDAGGSGVPPATPAPAAFALLRTGVADAAAIIAAGAPAYVRAQAATAAAAAGGPTAAAAAGAMDGAADAQRQHAAAEPRAARRAAAAHHHHHPAAAGSIGAAAVAAAVAESTAALLRGVTRFLRHRRREITSQLTARRLARAAAEQRKRDGIVLGTADDAIAAGPLSDDGAGDGTSRDSNGSSDDDEGDGTDGRAALRLQRRHARRRAGDGAADPVLPTLVRSSRTGRTYYSAGSAYGATLTDLPLAELEALALAVDAALMRALVKGRRRRALAGFVAQSKEGAALDIVDARIYLADAGCYCSLAALYRSRGMAREALTVWRDLGTGAIAESWQRPEGDAQDGAVGRDVRSASGASSGQEEDEGALRWTTYDSLSAGSDNDWPHQRASALQHRRRGGAGFFYSDADAVHASHGGGDAAAALPLGARESIAYLAGAAATVVPPDLVFEFSIWLLLVAPREALAVFTSATRVPAIPHGDVITFLSEEPFASAARRNPASGASLRLYLEHLVTTSAPARGGSPSLPVTDTRVHTTLAREYLAVLLQLRGDASTVARDLVPAADPRGVLPPSAGAAAGSGAFAVEAALAGSVRERPAPGDEGGMLGTVRGRLVRLLQESRFIDADTLLHGLIGFGPAGSYLLEERVLLHARLGQHAEALALLVHRLADADLAIKYCALVTAAGRAASAAVAGGGNFNMSAPLPSPKALVTPAPSPPRDGNASFAPSDDDEEEGDDDSGGDGSDPFLVLLRLYLAADEDERRRRAASLAVVIAPRGGGGSNSSGSGVSAVAGGARGYTVYLDRALALLMCPHATRAGRPSPLAVARALPADLPLTMLMPYWARALPAATSAVRAAELSKHLFNVAYISAHGALVDTQTSRYTLMSSDAGCFACGGQRLGDAVFAVLPDGRPVHFHCIAAAGGGGATISAAGGGGVGAGDAAAATDVGGRLLGLNSSQLARRGGSASAAAVGADDDDDIALAAAYGVLRLWRIRDEAPEGGPDANRGLNASDDNYSAAIGRRHARGLAGGGGAADNSSSPSSTSSSYAVAMGWCLDEATGGGDASKASRGARLPLADALSPPDAATLPPPSGGVGGTPSGAIARVTLLDAPSYVRTSRIAGAARHPHQRGANAQRGGGLGALAALPRAAAHLAALPALAAMAGASSAVSALERGGDAIARGGAKGIAAVEKAANAFGATARALPAAAAAAVARSGAAAVAGRDTTHSGALHNGDGEGDGPPAAAAGRAVGVLRQAAATSTPRVVGPAGGVKPGANAAAKPSGAALPAGDATMKVGGGNPFL